MTDTATTPAHMSDDTAPLFDAAELREFAAADVEAGRGICKLLSVFFFYTVIVMALSTVVTWYWVR
ncbi:MAG: hypothetical protein R3B90_14105 [Planctomycetaceae bacterium]